MGGVRHRGRPVLTIAQNVTPDALMFVLSPGQILSWTLIRDPINACQAARQSRANFPGKVNNTRRPEKHVRWVDRTLTKLARERYCEADAGRAEPVISSPARRLIELLAAEWE